VPNAAQNCEDLSTMQGQHAKSETFSHIAHAIVDSFMLQFPATILPFGALFPDAPRHPTSC